MDNILMHVAIDLLAKDQMAAAHLDDLVSLKVEVLGHLPEICETLSIKGGKYCKMDNKPALSNIIYAEFTVTCPADK